MEIARVRGASYSAVPCAVAIAQQGDRDEGPGRVEADGETDAPRTLTGRNNVGLSARGWVQFVPGPGAIFDPPLRGIVVVRMHPCYGHTAIVRRRCSYRSHYPCHTWWYVVEGSW